MKRYELTMKGKHLEYLRFSQGSGTTQVDLHLMLFLLPIFYILIIKYFL